MVAGLAGIIISFLLCGFIAVAGKRGSAPTMVLSRAAFGVRGNKLPSVISWLLTVGWETVLMILATLATATVFERLGWGGGTATKVIALIVVAGLTIAGGVIGFDLIMRMQTVITIVTGGAHGRSSSSWSPTRSTGHAVSAHAGRARRSSSSARWCS